MMYRLCGRTCHKPLINSYTMKNIFIILLAFLSPPFLYGVNVGMDSLKQEKVYVHMDKPFYLVGDTIWMKGYLVDMRTHREQDARSRFLYVELISDKDKVLLRKKIMEENGIFRNFFLWKTIFQKGGICFVPTPILCAMQMNPFFIRDSLLFIRIRNPYLC